MGEGKFSRIQEKAMDLPDMEGKIKPQDKGGDEAGTSGVSK